MWNNFLLNTIFRVMVQIDEKVENSKGKILKRKVVQCFMLNVHLAFTLALAREISKIQHLIYSKTQNRLDLAGKGKTFLTVSSFLNRIRHRFAEFTLNIKRHMLLKKKKHNDGK